MDFIILIPLQKCNAMARYFIFFLVILNIGCQSSRLNKSLSSLKEPRVITLDNCPEKSTCTIEIIPHSTLIIKEDEFKNTYIEILKGTKTIIKYQYKKDEIPNTADSHYSEIVFIETDNYDKNIFLKNEQLQEVKMVFGRLCYCKGSSGYFRVIKGELELTVKKNKLTLNTNFSVDNIPQIIANLNETIILDK